MKEILSPFRDFFYYAAVVFRFLVVMASTIDIINICHMLCLPKSTEETPTLPFQLNNSIVLINNCLFILLIFVVEYLIDILHWEWTVSSNNTNVPD